MINLLIGAWILAALAYILVTNFWPGAWRIIGPRMVGSIVRLGTITNIIRGSGIVHVQPWEKVNIANMRGIPMSISLDKLATGIGNAVLPPHLVIQESDTPQIKALKAQQAAALSSAMEFGLDLEAVIEPVDPLKWIYSLRLAQGQDAADVMGQFLRGAVQQALNQMTGNVLLSGKLNEVIDLVKENFVELAAKWGGEVKALTIQDINLPAVIVEATEIVERGVAEATRMRALSAAEVETAANQIAVEGQETYRIKEVKDIDAEIGERYAKAIESAKPQVLVMPGGNSDNNLSQLVPALLTLLKRAGGQNE